MGIIHPNFYLLKLFSVFIWDIYLSNDKDTFSFTDNDFTIYNSGMKICSNGSIYLTREMLSKVQCSMDLREFPHDVQHCEMKFLSFLYDISEVNFTQNVLCGDDEPCDNSVSPVESSAFKMISTKGLVATEQWGNVTAASVVVKIAFQRQLSFYLYQVKYLLLFRI